MDPFIAQIVMFGGNFAPRGWAFCDGQLLPISQYSALFSLLGTIYGGDGRTTFALPDLRGRVAIHPGNGPGLSDYRVGQKGGVENVTLTINQIPEHNHTVHLGAGLAADPVGVNQSLAANTGTDTVFTTALPSSSSPLHSSSLSKIGGNQGHTNIQPYLAVYHIIALQGVFPSRS